MNNAKKISDTVICYTIEQFFNEYSILMWSENIHKYTHEIFNNKYNKVQIEKQNSIYMNVRPYANMDPLFETNR